MLEAASNPDQLRALDRVKEWTRTRFRLSEDAVIMVSEIACAVPGCPPLETIVLFWTAEQTRHHFKVFKRAQDIIDDDLPVCVDAEVAGFVVRRRLLLGMSGIVLQSVANPVQRIQCARNRSDCTELILLGTRHSHG